MNKTAILITICCLLLSCESKSNRSSEQNTSTYSPSDYRNTIDYQSKILCKGDTSAFNSFNGMMMEEQFPYALFLANKYNYAVANYAVYYQLCQAFEIQCVSSCMPDTIEKEFIASFKKYRKEKILNHNLKYFNSQSITLDILIKLNESGYFGKLKTNNDILMLQMAFEHLRESAEQGNAMAEKDLATAYFIGYGVKNNMNKGIYFYKRYIDHIRIVSCTQDTIERQIQSNKNGTNSLQVIPVTPHSLIRSDLSGKIKSGDIDAYNNLKKSYIGNDFELLIYSMIMATKYKYTPAYFDVYLYLWKTFNFQQKNDLWNMTCFDIKTKKLAMYYLNKSAMSGNIQAANILKKNQN